MSKTGIFIGRFQPFHEGHKACINSILSTHDRCLVLVRCGKKDKNNPYTLQERLRMIRDVFPDSDEVDIQGIHDPGNDLTVFYGRKVGYVIEELKLPPEVEEISASKIRDDNLDNR